MSGNVWEWCWDRYGDYGGASTDPTGARSGPDRVIRGGSWNNDPRIARVAYRNSGVPGPRGNNLGLRLVRTIP
ncbi:MAG: formylglycine-generating enzyme family protein [bacterium]